MYIGGDDLQALYRKYRPKTFEEIKGQEVIIETLKNQIKSDDIAHAYLFSGTRGTGKTSAAKIMARAVNCENPVDGSPCNQCGPCRGILEERVLDVIEMDAASNNSVDDIRELKDKAAYPPSMCKKKVYIIDEVHMLSKGAFNALLKILEEPPTHILFILATTEPERIPATITSRTQRYHFNRLKPEQISRDLGEILKKESRDYDDSALGLIASHSDGSMRDALSILDQTLSLTDEYLSDEVVKEALGLTDGEVLERIIDAILIKDPNLVLDQIGAEHRRGRNMSKFLSSIMGRFRDLLISKSTNIWPQDMAEKEGKNLLQQAQQFSYEELFYAIEVLNRSLGNLRYAQDAKLICEVTILSLLENSGLVNTPRRASVEETYDQAPIKVNTSNQTSTNKAKPEVRKEKVSNKEILKKFSSNAIISKETGGKVGDLDRIWDDMLKMIHARRPSTAALLREATLISCEGGQLVIGFGKKYDFHKTAIGNPGNKSILLEVSQSFFPNITEVKTITVEEKDPNLEKLFQAFGEDKVEIIDD